MFLSRHIKIDRGIDVSYNKPGRKIGSGKSIEYNIGTEIYNNFKVDDSAFFEGDINSSAVLSRLKRLNIQNETEFEYTTRKETDKKRDHSIGGMLIAIEGFRIHRIK